MASSGVRAAVGPAVVGLSAATASGNANTNSHTKTNMDASAGHADDHVLPSSVRDRMDETVRKTITRSWMGVRSVSELERSGNLSGIGESIDGSAVSEETSHNRRRKRKVKRRTNDIGDSSDIPPRAPNNLVISNLDKTNNVNNTTRWDRMKSQLQNEDNAKKQKVLFNSAQNRMAAARLLNRRTVVLCEMIKHEKGSNADDDDNGGADDDSDSIPLDGDGRRGGGSESNEAADGSGNGSSRSLTNPSENDGIILEEDPVKVDTSGWDITHAGNQQRAKLDGAAEITNPDGTALEKYRENQCTYMILQRESSGEKE
jgi:hypothetical protein